jgi:hypothetical protein
MTPVVVHRNARYCPLALEAYPTTTEPVEETSYPWLVVPPNVGSHVTVEPAPPPALTREVKTPSPTVRTISNAALGRNLLVTVTLLVNALRM